MGADLLLCSAWIKRGETPDFTKAKAHIEHVPNQTLDDILDGLGYDDEDEEHDRTTQRIELRERLTDVVAECEDAWNGQHRLIVRLDIGEYLVLIGGAPSWGDAPEGYETLALFVDSGCSRVAGFQTGRE